MTDTKNIRAWVLFVPRCLGGVCRPGRESTDRHSNLVKWLPAMTLPALALGLRGGLSGWEWMWVMAAALFLGAKWLTLWPLLRSRAPVPLGRWLAYALLWPGMDALAFCTGPAVPRPAVREWVGAVGKTLLGAALVWVGVPLVMAANPLPAGWVGMLGVVFLLHFGSFHLLALCWRARGVDARPIMRTPIMAPSLSAFWGGYWNRAFSDLMHRHLLAPLARRLGMRLAVAAVFLVSALMHELLISLPARGGYGLPTLYFAVQGLGLFLERSRVGRRLGLGRGWRGHGVALVVAGGPAFWLFHPPFIHNVILPMLRSTGAL